MIKIDNAIDNQGHRIKNPKGNRFWHNITSQSWWRSKSSFDLFVWAGYVTNFRKSDFTSSELVDNLASEAYRLPRVQGLDHNFSMSNIEAMVFK